jgi:sugar lactone lactonase YvrE
MKTQPARREFLEFTAAAMAAPFFQPQVSSKRISTIAGTGVAGLAADGDVAERATLNNPFGLVIGPDGALYWAEYGSHRVLRLDLRTRRISVIAGNGNKGYSGDGGPATAAQLNTPHEVRFDSKGNIYVAERLTKRNYLHRDWHRPARRQRKPPDPRNATLGSFLATDLTDGRNKPP